MDCLRERIISDPLGGLNDKLRDGLRGAWDILALPIRSARDAVAEDEASTSQPHLAYYGFRDYDPAKGRYTTSASDPSRLQGGLNTYAYVNGTPSSLIEPKRLAVDVNLFPMCNNKVTPLDKVLRDGADNYANSDGEFSVAAHGEPKVVLDMLGKPISPRQLADMIQSNPNWSPEKIVRLIACNTGKYSDSYARDLAKALGSPVLAPDNYVWGREDGGFNVYESSGPDLHEPNRSKSGNWVRFLKLNQSLLVWLAYSSPLFWGVCVSRKRILYLQMR